MLSSSLRALSRSRRSSIIDRLMPYEVDKCFALAIAIQHIFELFLSTQLKFRPFFHRRSFSVCVRTQSRWQTINKKWVGIPLSLFSNKTTENWSEPFRKTFSQKFYHSHAQKSPIFVSFQLVFFFTTIIAVQYLRFRLERIPFFSHSLEIMFYRRETWDLIAAEILECKPTEGIRRVSRW